MCVRPATQKPPNSRDGKGAKVYIQPLGNYEEDLIDEEEKQTKRFKTIYVISENR